MLISNCFIGVDCFYVDKNRKLNYSVKDNHKNQVKKNDYDLIDLLKWLNSNQIIKLN